MNKLTHFDDEGNARMVDVSSKIETKRIALARGAIKVSEEIMNRIKDGTVEKGDVLGVARIAGIMGSKATSNIIPMCHPLMINGANVDFELDEENSEIIIYGEVKTTGKTGVEMEALTAVSIAALTIYDMCKAIDKGMIIREVHLVSKKGGKSGDFYFNEGGER
ncbi:MAG: cyclic pyranopterin monophosphate synthase MoaC [Sarcina sp.]